MTSEATNTETEAGPVLFWIDDKLTVWHNARYLGRVKLNWNNDRAERRRYTDAQLYEQFCGANPQYAHYDQGVIRRDFMAIMQIARLCDL